MIDEPDPNTSVETASSRTVRIFISSTFLDFAIERDLLVRKVFPELRRRCRQRHVELIDVDLRWGITHEEARHGRVLPICLAEIDRCRPFFLGLIGDRYGWVPAADQYDQSLLLEQPWLRQHAGLKSVTELEILHGVLNNPEMAGRAFFYFRDPAWTSLQGPAYASEGAGEARDLADLRSRIRASGFPLLDGYANPEVLADRVREDLWSLIDAAFPEWDEPDPLSMERRRHVAYGDSRRRLYVGGEAYVDTLDQELAAESPRPVLIRGRSGSGKSALLANWLSAWLPRNPDTAAIVHHLGCGADAANPIHLTSRLMKEIAALTGKAFEPKANPDDMLDELSHWLDEASLWAKQSGRKVLIVLDGLDKLAESRHVRWFPVAVPPCVSLVVSCLDGDVLDTVRSRLDWTELFVQPFTESEQAKFIQEYLGRYRKQVTAVQASLLQSHSLAGNPLFLLTVLEELRVFGIHEELNRRLATLLAPPQSKSPDESPSVNDAFVHVIERLEGDYGRDAVRPVLEAIWASKAGLYVDELLAVAEVPPAILAGIEYSLDEALFECGGRITFGHDYLRKAVEIHYAIDHAHGLELHLVLARHFATLEPGARVAEELPWQWRQAEERRRLRECLSDLRIFLAASRRDQLELLEYWNWLEADISSVYEAEWNHLDAYDAYGLDDEFILDISEALESFLFFAGQFTSFTARLFRMSVDAAEQSFGPDDPHTLECVYNLASCAMVCGDLEYAASNYRRALDGFERALGSSHPLTIASCGSLARILGEEGDDVTAEAMLRRAVEGSADARGRHDQQTLTFAVDLASSLSKQGKFEEAQAMFNCSIDGLGELLGPDHPETLKGTAELAWHFSRRQDLATAEEMFRRTLDGLQKSIGADHPHTLESIDGLAVTLSKQGEYAPADVLLRQALAGFEDRLGLDHPRTLLTLQNLVVNLSLQKDYAAARRFCRRGVDSLTERFGSDDRRTINAVNLLFLVEDFVDETTPAPRRWRGPSPPGMITNSIGMKFVPIPAGVFLMGSPVGSPFGNVEEEAQHRVAITRSLHFGMHQVTQMQYERVMNSNPSLFHGPDLPVEHLSWMEAQRFVELLTDLPAERAASRRYRLPTEAEWEYACRAGTTTPFNTGETIEPDQARFALTDRAKPKQTTSVGTYPPNAWGLFDMHGNVWEWTSDWFSSSYYLESPVSDPQGPTTGTHHTLRGGSATVVSHECRSAFRGEARHDAPGTDPGQRFEMFGDFGMRAICEVGPTSSGDESQGPLVILGR